MSYYTAKDGTELFDVLRAWNLNFARSNIVKYIVRSGRKPGEEALEAIRKAKHYAELAFRNEVDAVTPMQLVRSFELTDAQAEVVYHCAYGTPKTLLKALEKFEQSQQPKDTK